MLINKPGESSFLPIYWKFASISSLDNNSWWNLCGENHLRPNLVCRPDWVCRYTPQLSQHSQRSTKPGQFRASKRMSLNMFWRKGSDKSEWFVFFWDIQSSGPRVPWTAFRLVLVIFVPKLKLEIVLTSRVRPNVWSVKSLLITIPCIFHL